MGWFSKKTRSAKNPARKRGWGGAKTGRLFADFISNSKSADAELRYDLRTLRDRCRQLTRDDPYSKRFLKILSTNVVGPNGVGLQLKARNDDGRLDTVGNQIIERAWRRWGRRGVPTVDGRMSWKDAQRLFIESVARDGEVLLRHIRNADNPYGYAIQFLEADHLDEDYSTRADSKGRRVSMGVELDQFDRATGYYLWSAHPHAELGTKQSRRRVSADEILHAYLAERSHQSRGVPWMATTITRLKQLSGYEESELVAARVASAKMGFFTSPDGDGYSGEEYDDTYQPLMSAEPGTFEQLPTGMNFEAFDPSHPTTAFADFERAILRGIASGLNVSYHSLSGDLTSVNYSSIRQGALEERDYYRSLQQFTIEHFIEPIFRAWLEMAMTTGEITIPVSRFDKFADAVTWRPRGFAWIDPLKEIQANIAGLQNGLVTMQDVATQHGRDVEDVMEQIGREKQMAEQLGVTLAFEPFGASKNSVDPNIAGGDEP